MVSRDVVSVFMELPTDETLTVERENVAADPSLEDRNCITIDNPREMLAFCVEIRCGSQ